MAKPKTGTREWSDRSFNLQAGCSHGCLYCYARERALRFGQIADGADWTTETPFDRAATLAKARVRRRGGVTMFPTTHDIVPANLDFCEDVLIALLVAGNRVLVVSKAHLDCFARLTRVRQTRASQIEFRVTLGGLDPATLRFWEPAAPEPAERIEALKLAKARGFKTSVSAEPLLEPWEPLRLVEAVEPFAETIWIGACNDIRRRTAWARAPKPKAGLEKHVGRLEEWQTPGGVRSVAYQLRDNPKVRWKESIAEALGLNAEEVG